MSEEKLYNLSQLREVAAGSEDFVNKMVDMFLDMTPALVERIAQGVQSQDWDEVQSASHKIKPSIDMMGISSLHDLIRQIESSAKQRNQLEELPQLTEQLQQSLEGVYQQLKSR